MFLTCDLAINNGDLSINNGDIIEYCDIMDIWIIHIGLYGDKNMLIIYAVLKGIHEQKNINGDRNIVV